MDKKHETPQRNLRRFYIGGRGRLKRTFRFTRQNASFYFFGTLRFADYINEYYLFFATHNLIKTEEYKRHWGRFSSMKIVIPKIELQQKFNKLIREYEKMKRYMYSQNTLLTRQRDLLLPRLMSGKLEVKP